MTYIAGTCRKHNANTSGEYTYFLPSLLPTTYVAEDPKLNRLLEEATHSLGELNAYARFVPDIDYFIRMHETKEATASSKIEGTRTNMGEALMSEKRYCPRKKGRLARSSELYCCDEVCYRRAQWAAPYRPLAE